LTEAAFDGEREAATADVAAPDDRATPELPGGELLGVLD